MSTPRQLPAIYDPVENVVTLYVPRHLPPAVFARAREIIAKANDDRARGLPPGDRKDVAERTATACRNGRIRQVISTKGEVELFQATTGTGKIISIGGSE